MIEYIEREPLRNLVIETLEGIKCNPKMDRQEMHIVAACAMLCHMINDRPAAAVAPVRHGRWVSGCVCSECGQAHGPRNRAYKKYYRYCSCCGAKMDEGDAPDAGSDWIKEN